MKQAGIAAFRSAVASLSPFARDRVDEIKRWDDVKLLTVAVDRLARWYRPGLVCIGDAAHAMSPIGGVGINLAIQDAVAAANILAEPLRRRGVTLDHLAQIQSRRAFPTKVTQGLQVFIQNNLIGPVLASDKRLKAPWLFRLMDIFPFLRRIPARLIGMGVRPEHVRIAEQEPA